VDCKDFIKDGMISSVSVDNKNKKLVISWNTISEKSDTEIYLSDLIADETVTHTELDTILTSYALSNDVDQKLSDYALSSVVTTLLAEKIDINSSYITNNWEEISSATTENTKIPTAFAIKEYIYHLLAENTN
jgi:hypothetical protein